MDQLTRLNYGMFFAMLVLPAWAVLRLSSPKISIPIGTLIFWGWLVLFSDFVGDIDPTRDGGFGPVFNIFFGWQAGACYCVIWFAIRRLVPRSKAKHVKNYVKLIGLVIWSALIGLCLCFPFMARALHHRSLGFYMPYVLIGVGPILVLCVAVVCNTVREMRKYTSRVLSSDDANIGIE
jgi:hypothetical protein